MLNQMIMSFAFYKSKLTHRNQSGLGFKANTFNVSCYFTAAGMLEVDIRQI